MKELTLERIESLLAKLAAKKEGAPVAKPVTDRLRKLAAEFREMPSPIGILFVQNYGDVWGASAAPAHFFLNCIWIVLRNGAFK